MKTRAGGLPSFNSVMILVLIVATALTSSPPAATAQDLLTARMAYDNCLIAAARKMDDGKSDAKTIAIAMQSECVPQTERVIRALASEMMVPGITAGQAYRSAKQIVDEQYIQNGTKAVLEARASQRRLRH
jgi:hypothetical protein